MKRANCSRHNDSYEVRKWIGRASFTSSRHLHQVGNGLLFCEDTPQCHLCDSPPKSWPVWGTRRRDRRESTRLALSSSVESQESGTGDSACRSALCDSSCLPTNGRRGAIPGRRVRGGARGEPYAWRAIGALSRPSPDPARSAPIERATDAGRQGRPIIGNEIGGPRDGRS
jgi:hypothetical protein